MDGFCDAGADGGCELRAPPRGSSIAVAFSDDNLSGRSDFLLKYSDLLSAFGRGPGSRFDEEALALEGMSSGGPLSSPSSRISSSRLAEGDGEAVCR